MALSRTDSVASSDLFALFKYGDSDWRGCPSGTVLEWIQENISLPGVYVTQYSAPSATGFSVQITDGSDDIHLILTPAAGYAAGTIVLPTSTNLVDGQRVLVNCTQAVTTLTINKNGATALTGAPTTLAANAFFTLKYDELTSTWYRVG